MKRIPTIATLTLITTFGIAGCGDSATDEPLPEGVAPGEVKQAPVATPETEATSQEPTSEPAPAGAETHSATVTEPGQTSGTRAGSDAPRTQAPGLSFVIPDGWSVGPKKDMRLLTLLPPNGGGADLAISKWPRDVGGFGANVTRWAVQQLGLPPIPDLTTAAASDYEKFNIDGQQATWIPLMNEQTNRAILAVWLPIGTDPLAPSKPLNTWTFKLTCRADQVEALAPAVRAWCESIAFD